MLKKKIVFVLLCSLLVTGCAQKPVVPATKPTEPVVTTKPVEAVPTTMATEPVDPLEALREEMEGTSYAFAVAYIGDTYEEEKDFPALLQELSPSVCQQYPFLLEISAENIVDLGWGEVYCVIPADPNASVHVYRAVEVPVGEWDYTWEYSELVYESETGAPFLLVCSQVDDLPGVRVSFRSEETAEVVWYPVENMYRQLEPLTNAEGEDVFWDLTSYYDQFLNYYRSNTDYMRLPTEADLLGKAWGWEGIALYNDRYTTYLMAFEEDGITIRWNDGIDEADHEITGIPWELNYVDEYAVLTLDLGGFAGVRSYDLLYDDEYGWLYTMTDLSDREVDAGDEIPFRNLFPRSLTAPDPTEMVGSWVRVLSEFEGYAEEDTSGNRTFVITGDSKDTLTISYTDREHPDSNYKDKTLKLSQGELYWQCGNSLWFADVEHVGPWDTTYAVTLLEDGRLLLQNYWEMDGAPSVSYEWFERVG